MPTLIAVAASRIQRWSFGIGCASELTIVVDGSHAWARRIELYGR